MGAVSVEIAQAIKNELDAAAAAEKFAEQFIAERAYSPTAKLEDMDTLHVTIVPKARRSAAGTREKDLEEYDIDIAVRKRFKAEPELDAMMLLAQQIGDFLRRRRLAQCDALACVALANEPIFIPEHLLELRQFTSVLTATYRGYR